MNRLLIRDYDLKENSERKRAGEEGSSSPFFPRPKWRLGLKIKSDKEGWASKILTEPDFKVNHLSRWFLRLDQKSSFSPKGVKASHLCKHLQIHDRRRYWEWMKRPLRI